MKKIILYLSVVFVWYSCDKIDAPYTENLSSDQGDKTLLIEKFTGHKCSGCPEASRVIENELKPQFLNKNDNNQSAIISVSIHPGLWGSSEIVSFTETDNDYPYDFTTNSGDTIGVDMGLSGFIPVGTINRIDGGDVSNKTWSKDNWGEQIENQLFDANGNAIEQTISIIINDEFNATTKTLNITTTINVLSSLEGNYYLCLFIMEDGIVSPQKDGINYIENYVHDHVYRCPVNNTYGEALNTTLTEGLTLTKSHEIIFNTNNNIHWDDDWNEIENCHIVAYVYNVDNGLIEEAAKKSINNE